MAKAMWNNQVLAESDKVEVVEGNKYFPPDSVNMKFFHHSNKHTTCPWKGEARYYTIVVDDKENNDAAWYYPNPSPAAKNIRNFVAFWKDVEVEE